MQRKPEPELMDLPDEVAAYAGANFLEVNGRFVDRLTELTDPIGDVLCAVDLGCGPGAIPILVGRRRTAWRVVGVDASQPMLDVAQSAAREAAVEDRVTFHLADATRTGLAEHSFRVVFSNSLLHHVKSPAAMWREVARLGQPGAVIFVRDLLRPESETQVAAIVKQHAGLESALLQEEFRRSLLAAYTVAEIREQLESVGLGSLGVAQISDRHVDVWGTID